MFVLLTKVGDCDFSNELLPLLSSTVFSIGVVVKSLTILSEVSTSSNPVAVTVVVDDGSSSV
ncbi:unnamed protein product [Schistosoma mattheei]|uniref:Uncharacterized protein n=1 Tax=Schistosoma mattheei TaxID=31246 RepID=A0A3P8GIT5_9TREM|nr:unnamed protein product [Schistosoma mattheei]